MDATRRAILEHHENFDGAGYPYGLRDEDISLICGGSRGQHPGPIYEVIGYEKYIANINRPISIVVK